MLFDKQDHIKITTTFFDIYLQYLTDEEVGKVMRDILQYCKTGTQSTLCGKAYEAWEYLKKCADFQETHPRWRGGLFSDEIAQRRTIRYKEWRNSVFSRDGFVCRICGQYGGHLNAHHIKPFSKFPDLRTTVSNGITLCYECHRKVHRRDIECPTG